MRPILAFLAVLPTRPSPLTKPFLGRDSLDAIRQAMGRDRAMRQEQSDLAGLRKRYESLTEREVMGLVVSGMLNKQVASQLGNQRNHREDSSRARDGEDEG